jgi:hypothetical protein
LTQKGLFMVAMHYTHRVHFFVQFIQQGFAGLWILCFVLNQAQVPH